MCGWTCVGIPNCNTRRLSRAWIMRAERRVPLRLTNNAGSSGLASSTRREDHARMATRATAPTGTTRVLLRLPSTRSSPAATSDRQSTFKPSSSARRRPEE